MALPLDLLSQLAAEDPQVIRMEPEDTYEDSYAFRVIWRLQSHWFFYMKQAQTPFDLPPGHQNDPVMVEGFLFWVLLDRIKARGWKYAIHNNPDIADQIAVGVRRQDEGLTSLGRMSFGQSECEALARAYLQALGQEEQG